MDPSSYPNPRFISEFGFQSLPNYGVLKRFTIEEDWSYKAPMIWFRNRGWGDITGQINRHYDVSRITEDKEDDAVDIQRQNSSDEDQFNSSNTA